MPCARARACWPATSPTCACEGRPGASTGSSRRSTGWCGPSTGSRRRGSCRACSPSASPAGRATYWAGWSTASSARASPSSPGATARRRSAARTPWNAPSSSTSSRSMPRPARHMDGVCEALSIKYNNLVYELHEAGADVIVLSLGEAFFALPLNVFSSLPQPAIFHYSHSRGVPALRELLARYYRDRYGVPVDPADEILVTAGSKVAIQMSLMSLLDPGDEVVI